MTALRETLEWMGEKYKRAKDTRNWRLLIQNIARYSFM
jgi:hypothetical protein